MGTGIEREEAAAIIRACGTGWLGARNAAHIALLYRGGLRSMESCRLELADVVRKEVDGEDRWAVHVRYPKGWARARNPAPPRWVGLDAGTAALLARWLRHRGEEPGPLFRTRTGLPVHPSYLRQVLPRLARAAGVRKRVHPHGFRHACAGELLEEGVNVRVIQSYLGHRNLNTTQVYLERRFGAAESVEAGQKRRFQP